MKRGTTHFGGVLTFFLLLIAITCTYGQKGKTGNEPDTIFVKDDMVLILEKNVYVPQNDTTVIIPPRTKYRLRKNPYQTSEAFYKSLQTKTDKNKLTREMYNFLIVRSDQNIADSVRLTDRKEDYKSFLGMRIGKIYYGRVPMFQGNVNDTLKVAVNKLSQILNKWHVRTRDKVIRSNLFFREGDLLNPDQLADNERVLRHLPYIQDARIYVMTDPVDSTVVDVIVVTQDQFPWGVDPDIKDENRFNLTITHSNMAGLGLQAYGGVLVNLKDTLSKVGYKTGFRYDNIAGSFISGKIEYLNSHGRKWLGIQFDKDFLTPRTKWGGGLSYNIHRDDSIHVSYQDTVIFYRYSANLQDYWLGRSFLINRARRKRVIASGRFAKNFFLDQPYVEPDSNVVFHDKWAVLGSVILFQRDFYKTNMVFNYGPAEDIPYGFLLKLTGGCLDDEFYERPYIGMEAAWGKFFNHAGYFSFEANTGGLIYDEGWRDVLLKAKSYYLSPLSRLGNYKLRQMGTLYYALSASDLSGEFIRYDGQIPGLNEYKIWGKSVLVATLENSFFTPWYFYSFRFVFYGTLAGGIISKEKNVFANPQWQGSVRIGLRIFNPSLVFNRIDISLAYLFNNGGGSSPFRYDFYMNRHYIHYLNNIERPEMVYE